MVDEVGARLSVQNRVGFARDMRASAQDVEQVGQEAAQTARRAGLASRALSTMGVAGRSVGRTLGASVAPSRAFALSLGVGVGGLALAARRGWQELQELDKVEKQTAARMKSTGGIANVSARHIRQRSIALESLTSIDENLIGTGQNLLLTFKNVRNELGRGNRIFDRATVSALNLSTAGFGSVDSASKMLGKSLNDPVYGMTALSRAGVTFTAQQKETVARMVEANDTLSAQKLILGEVESQVAGSAKKYGDSIEGMGNRINDGFGDLSRGLMTGLVPIVERYARPFTQWLGDVTDVVNRRGWKAAWNEFVPPEIRHNIDSIAGAVSGALVPAVTAFGIKIGIATMKLAPFLVLGSALADLLGVQVTKSDQLSKSMKEKLGPGLGSAAEKLGALTRELNEMGPGGKAAAGLGLLLGPSLIRGGIGALGRRRAGSIAGTAARGAATAGSVGLGTKIMRSSKKIPLIGTALVALTGAAAFMKKEADDRAAYNEKVRDTIRLFGIEEAERRGLLKISKEMGGFAYSEHGEIGTLKELAPLHRQYMDRLTGSSRAGKYLAQITRDVTGLNKGQMTTLGTLVGGYDELGGALSKHEGQMVNNLLAVGDFRGALRLLKNELQENTRWLDNMSAAGRRAEEQSDWAWRTGRPHVPSGGGGGKGGGGRGGGGGGDNTPAPSGPRPERRTGSRTPVQVTVELKGREVGEAFFDIVDDMAAES